MGPPISLLMDKVKQDRQQLGDEHRASPRSVDSLPMLAEPTTTKAEAPHMC